MNVVLFIVALFLPLSAVGITLQEAENAAVKNYPKLKSLKYKALSLARKADSIQRDRFGTLNIDSVYQTFNRNYMLVPLSSLPSPKNPPPFDSRKLLYGFSFSVPIYTGGTISQRVKIERLKSRIYELLLEDSKWRIKFNVDSLYLSYLALDVSKDSLQAYRKSLEKLRETVKTGVKAGKFAQVDLLKVEADLAEVVSRIRDLEQKEKALLVALETLVGKRIKKLEPFTVDYKYVKLSFDELYSKLLKNNNFIKVKDYSVKSASEMEKLASSKYGIRCLISGSYYRNYGFDTGENEGVGSISFSLRYPIFSFGRKRLDRLSARLMKLSAVSDKEEAKRVLKRELSEAVSKLLSLQSRIEALKKKLVYEKKVEEVEKLKYLNGKGDMDHLLLAKARRFMAEAELKSSFYRWEIERRRIEALVEEK